MCSDVLVQLTASAPPASGAAAAAHPTRSLPPMVPNTSTVQLHSPKDFAFSHGYAIWQAFRGHVMAVSAGAPRAGSLPDELLEPVLRWTARATLQTYEKTFLASKEWAYYCRLRTSGLLESLRERPAPVSADEFERLGVIGSGSYGSVFCWRHRATGVYYAVKQCEKRVLKSKASVHTVIRELSCSLVTDSSAICGFEWCFEDADKLYCGMALHWRGDLERWLLAQPLKRFTEDQARLYVAELIIALAALHRQGVFHRDIKASNVLIDDSGHLRLTDFGLSVFGHRCSLVEPCYARICKGEPSDVLKACCLGCLTVTKLKELQKAAEAAEQRGLAPRLAGATAAEQVSAQWQVSKDVRMGSAGTSGRAATAPVTTTTSSSSMRGPTGTTTSAHTRRISGGEPIQSSSAPRTGAGSTAMVGIGSDKQSSSHMCDTIDCSSCSCIGGATRSSRAMSFQGASASDSQSRTSRTMVDDAISTPKAGAGAFAHPESRAFVNPTVLVAVDCSCPARGDDGTLWYRGRAGTSAYWAPQMLQRDSVTNERLPYGAEADFWSLGCITFALMTGRSPFATGLGTASDNSATLAGSAGIHWPKGIFSKDARDFITRLCSVDPAKRLGAGPAGWRAVMAHPWLSSVDFGLVEVQVLSPPPPPSYRVATNWLVVPDKIENQRVGVQAEEAAAAEAAARAAAASAVLTAEDEAIFASCVYTAPHFRARALLKAVTSVLHLIEDMPAPRWTGAR